MEAKGVRYCVVDAFTDSPFKGNPAAVCLLEEEKKDEWMQAVAREFNFSQTCYLTRDSDSSVPRFRLRWFTPVAEVTLCGHATLAAAHFLFSLGLVGSDAVDLLTLSGILTAKRIPASEMVDSLSSQNGNVPHGFFIELNFPAVSIAGYDRIANEELCLSKCLNGASFNEIHRTTPLDDLLVLLPSATAVTELEPDLDEVRKCNGRGLIVTAVAPIGSGFDFFSRFFAPKFGINEDPVCGSAHCALASYWSKKLGKTDLIAYQASPRSGILHLHLDKTNNRVFLRGKAISVMEGTLLV